MGKVEGIRIHSEMIESSAFGSLSKTAMIVYFDFLMKCADLKKSKIRLAPLAAEALNAAPPISKPAFRRAQKRLEERGLVEILPGGATRRSTSPFISKSGRWQNWSTNETNK